MGTTRKNKDVALHASIGRGKLLVMLAALCFAQAATAERVWGEGGLATVIVGVDPANKAPVRAKPMLIALGPDKVEPYAQHDRFASCVKNAVVTVVKAEATWRVLARSVRRWSTMADDIRQAGQPINSSSLSAARAARLQQVGAVFADAQKRFRSHMAGCGLPRELVAAARLAIVNRVCLETGSNPCTGNDYLTNPEVLVRLPLLEDL